MERASRYDAIVATFVGVLALAVSAYTAYIQKQQVRAQVLPILEYGTSNMPSISVDVANKGVGPALIRHVAVTVDGVAVTTWDGALEHLLGPGKHIFSYSTISGRVMSPGESIGILIPDDDDGAPLTPAAEPSLAYRLNKARYGIGVEICYCSTLGDCWTLVAGERRASSTTETRGCPKESERTFKQ